ncbi:MAG TPA: helix-hairpin-helix domain-containing protein [Chitinophagales bacterium]|nr:helix-hairpin-helix domain-containing protein [Chitinophagales bacterium]
MEDGLTGKQITQTLELLGKLMELHDQDAFRAKGLQSAAYNLNKAAVDVVNGSDEALLAIPGVGKTVLGKIHELRENGSLPELLDLMSKTPPGVIGMLRIKGLGPKKIAMIWRTLGVETVHALEMACADNRVAELRGFGPKTQQAIMDQIEFIKEHNNQRLLANVESTAELLLSRLKSVCNPHPVYVTGEYYRCAQTLGALQFVTNAEGLALIQSNLSEYHPAALGDDQLAFEVDGFPVQVHGVADGLVEWYRFRYSLAEGHREALVEKGWDERPKRIADDAEIYAALELPFIVPEMREGNDEFEWAAKYNADDLVTARDFNGMIHMHTTYSDGFNSIREMADACIAMQAQYMVLSDHSQSAGYAGGLKPDKLKQQHAEVDTVNKELNGKFKIFKSIESDILMSGKLDYPDEILATFDLVIASIHAGQKMSEPQGTARLIKAIENPYTTILGHPTGRLLLRRPGYPIDHEKVIDACAANNVVLEINANPNRLDVDWTWVWYAMERGVMLAVNPDAHNIDGLHDVRFGLHAARKGGLVRKHLLNALSLDAFEVFLQQQLKKR